MTLEPGQTLGRWTLLTPARLQTGQKAWACKCACGTSRDVRLDRLVSGSSRSCGCAARETHVRLTNEALKGRRT